MGLTHAPSLALTGHRFMQQRRIDVDLNREAPLGLIDTPISDGTNVSKTMRLTSEAVQAMVPSVLDQRMVQTSENRSSTKRRLLGRSSQKRPKASEM